MNHTILHINTGFATRKVHSGLVKSLDELDTKQIVYSPVRRKKEIDGNRDDSLKNTQYCYSYILRPWHKLFFRLKIQQIFKDINRKINLSTVDVTHAHTLYSDGAVSLKMKKYKDIPYIVSVRNVDINAYMKWRPDLKWKRDEILKHAFKVNFLSPAYKKQLLNILPESLANEVQQKSETLPNGLDKLWFNDEGLSLENLKHEKIRLLYVGEFTKNKNVMTLLKAAKLLSEEKKVELTLVGSGGNGEKEIDDTIASPEYSFVKKIGRVNNVNKLREIYQSHDIFVMISKRETFGVVYLEALSQGLPIIHSKGQGIDGYFKNGLFSYSVDPDCAIQVKNGILELFEKKNEIKDLCRSTATKFTWSNISERYLLHVFER